MAVAATEADYGGLKTDLQRAGARVVRDAYGAGIVDAAAAVGAR